MKALRLLVLGLVLLNGLYLAWSQGWLQAYGLGPHDDREPQRLTRQIRPEALRLLTPDPAPSPLPVTPVASVPGAPVCLQAGVFDETQARALREALQAGWPEGSWQLQAVTEPARWIVYVGRFPTPEAAQRRRAELASLNLRFEPLTQPELLPGLSLGAYASQAQAEEALAALTRRGLRKARVMQERAARQGQRLQLPAVDEALRARLDSLAPVLAGQPLAPCP